MLSKTLVLSTDFMEEALLQDLSKLHPSLGVIQV